MESFNTAQRNPFLPCEMMPIAIPQTELCQNVPEGLGATAAFTVYIEKAIIHASLKALRNSTCLEGHLFGIDLACLIFNFADSLLFL